MDKIKKLKQIVEEEINRFMLSYNTLELAKMYNQFCTEKKFELACNHKVADIHYLYERITTFYIFLLKNEKNKSVKKNIEKCNIQRLDDLFDKLNALNYIMSMNRYKQMKIEEKKNTITVKNFIDIKDIKDDATIMGLQALNSIEKYEDSFTEGKETSWLDEDTDKDLVLFKKSFCKFLKLDNFEIKGVSISKIYSFYKVIFRMVYSKEEIELKRLKPKLIYISKESIERFIKSKKINVEFEMDEIIQLLNIFTFDENDKKACIHTQPFVYIQGSYYISNLLLETINIENNIQMFFENEELTTIKEVPQLKDLESIIKNYKNIKYAHSIKKIKTKAGKKIEIDFILYDEISESLFILECKNFREPDNVYEHQNSLGFRNKVDYNKDNKGIFKAYKQLDVLQNDVNLCDISKKVFNKDIKIISVNYYVVLQKYLPNIMWNHKIFNNYIFKILMDKFNGDLSKIADFINNNQYIPQKNIDYSTSYKHIVIDKVKIKIENIIMTTEQINEFLLRLKSKI